MQSIIQILFNIKCIKIWIIYKHIYLHMKTLHYSHVIFLFLTGGHLVVAFGQVAAGILVDFVRRTSNSSRRRCSSFGTLTGRRLSRGP